MYEIYDNIDPKLLTTATQNLLDVTQSEWAGKVIVVSKLFVLNFVTGTGGTGLLTMRVGSPNVPHHALANNVYNGYPIPINDTMEIPGPFVLKGGTPGEVLQAKCNVNDRLQVHGAYAVAPDNGELFRTESYMLTSTAVNLMDMAQPEDVGTQQQLFAMWLCNTSSVTPVKVTIARGTTGVTLNQYFRDYTIMPGQTKRIKGPILFNSGVTQHVLQARATVDNVVNMMAVYGKRLRLEPD